ncbi:hypothetical protein GCM10011360_10620 [Primorskyibacter flagellatus]|uniref:DUF4167 domain-containing protein n=2 Tax=Primorskyibacter flagellatus TaxID=1387277 RepID=A0A917A333_9RHOB|nr:hypothetical protein GCM10011360_10620 [Primorskyibacter flagellatus]
MNDSQFSKADQRPMRSSKSRSRNKSNRNRSVGNVVNRVFDSSGPEGKVRGTPQQIIEKYNQLARDAQLSGDRVATENFQQHAEHYLRMLSAAQKEQDKQREQQDQENRNRQSQRDRDRARQEQEDSPSEDLPAFISGSAPGEGDQPDVMESSDRDSGLVETPENRQPAEEPKSKPKRTYNRKPRAKAQNNGGEGNEGSGGAGSTEAAE